MTASKTLYLATGDLHIKARGYWFTSGGEITNEDLRRIHKIEVFFLLFWPVLKK